MTKTERTVRRIARETEDAMCELGTWRDQFRPAVRMYADMKQQLAELMREFVERGGKITEEYINNGGAKNERKTALYAAIETLRRDVAAAEDRLGLTPVGMKRINEAEMKGRKKKSKLNAAIDNLNRSLLP